jgi:two-component sensor histidine kinase
MSQGEDYIAFEAKHLLPGAETKWIAVRAQVFRGSDGQPNRILGVAMDVTERHDAEDRLQIAARELQHRVKNTLAVVQTLASQTFRGGRSADESLGVFSARLRALANATEIVTRSEWLDANVRDILDLVTMPYRDATADAFTFEGPTVMLPSKSAIGLGMAIHELCTNATKYGALGHPGGRVEIRWSSDTGKRVRLLWRETGGPPVREPERRGFGTRLLERGVFEGASGQIRLDFDPLGVICRIEMPGSEPLS